MQYIVFFLPANSSASLSTRFCSHFTQIHMQTHLTSYYSPRVISYYDIYICTIFSSEKWFVNKLLGLCVWNKSHKHGPNTDSNRLNWNKRMRLRATAFQPHRVPIHRIYTMYNYYYKYIEMCACACKNDAIYVRKYFMYATGVLYAKHIVYYYHSARLGSTRVGLAWLDLAWLDLTWLGSYRPLPSSLCILCMCRLYIW